MVGLVATKTRCTQTFGGELKEIIIKEPIRANHMLASIDSQKRFVYAAPQSGSLSEAEVVVDSIGKASLGDNFSRGSSV